MIRCTTCSNSSDNCKCEEIATKHPEIYSWVLDVLRTSIEESFDSHVHRYNHDLAGRDW